ncbi:MAG: SMP-30/gluconolactonase/LRE family protein [Rhodospirillaceae bacterium]|nr:SMP-30/gluconolactonase/LRE family protein [Rhodospirillaceae bacterium]MBT5039334.1 SMP-30/gluconolactonase/LRE family protein [Rhodospirillaceae bacterium]MBT5674478.1 SMP-30/gluconolactonase/LRE family protein [Rhodospirillaceae bacterium]MBT6829044.1 SMP-30/gluconolactonase/LRE family protein [Rhodospirillaceae bacterium]
MTVNPLDGFSVAPEDIKFIGDGLQRPECILAERDGTLWSADARGGVVRIAPDGTQQLIAATEQAKFSEADGEEARFTQGTLPNGLAFAENGDILIANYGTDLLEQMSRSGETVTLHDNIDGKPMGKVNFVLRDSKNRIWITISTRAVNWMRSFTPDVDDGYVALVDQGTIRIVADGFTFTNEIRLDAKEEFLYVVETTGKRISRLRVQEDGELIGREVFGPSNLGKGFPDGITFDAYGNLWGTLIMSDQLFALTPEGECRILFEDGDDAATDALERAFLAREITPELMLAASGKVAPWMASVTFGGADLKTVYLGSLRGERIPYFRSPVAGLPMVHW